MRVTRHAIQLTMIAGLAATTLGGQTAPPPLVYRVDGIDGRLRRIAPAPELRLAAGAQLAAGADLATGWWSHAELSVPSAAAHFSLGPRTRVTLAADRPGVLLAIGKGRVRGVFGLLGEGDERERLVETPSAVLAVRGTDYGVAVDGSGETRLVVFAGTVEVMGRAGEFPPIQVHAGEQTAIRRGSVPAPPVRHELDPRGWDHGAMGVPGAGGGADDRGRESDGDGGPGHGGGERPGPGPGSGGGSPGHGG